jgi:hypothetical protein
MDRRSRALWVSSICGALILLSVTYALSYAPVFRWQMERQNTMCPEGKWRQLYDPVNWMIDRTPLRPPLLSWADYWNVRSPMETESWYRVKFSE